MAGRPRAVLDANVFVSGVLSAKGPPGRILRALRAGAIHLVTSEEINEEILAVPDRPRIRDRYPVGDRIFDVAVLLFNAETLLAAPRPVRASRDPDDDKYLAAAVEGGAQYLVPGDESGLLVLREFEGVRILTPRAFLSILRSG
ncbi:MAG TPA: putative toxin-antitoxin system toxin component, PIN family [Planctomycetota bacterium]|nr:putative toxin-antitoxin system toxin component, PIN family [Planctomycetota bacterium]